MPTLLASVFFPLEDYQYPLIISLDKTYIMRLVQFHNIEYQGVSITDVIPSLPHYITRSNSYKSYIRGEAVLVR